MIAQLIGGAVAIGAVRMLYPDITPAEAAEAVLPYIEEREPADTAAAVGAEV